MIDFVVRVRVWLASYREWIGFLCQQKQKQQQQQTTNNTGSFTQQQATPSSF